MKPMTSVTARRRVGVLRLIQTTNSPVETALRVTLGVVLLPHGAQHLLGMFGGYGFRGTLEWMTGTLGLHQHDGLCGGPLAV